MNGVGLSIVSLPAISPSRNFSLSAMHPSPVAVIIASIGARAPNSSSDSMPAATPDFTTRLIRRRRFISGIRTLMSLRSSAPDVMQLTYAFILRISVRNSFRRTRTNWTAPNLRLRIPSPRRAAAPAPESAPRIRDCRSAVRVQWPAPIARLRCRRPRPARAR